jgi:glycosyltransferase involved in cell wall biosynthesis
LKKSEGQLDKNLLFSRDFRMLCPKIWTEANMRNRLLAIVGERFPWKFSGYRYWENLEFHNIDENILFFAVHKMNDYFPAEVHPLEDIIQYPITDIYCVFLNHTLGLLDYPGELPGKRTYGLLKFIRNNNIAIHTTIYPGGGFEENTMDQAITGLKYLKQHPNVKTVFANPSEITKVIPKAYSMVNANTNTDFYKFIPRNKSKKLHILFAATCREEKGFKYMAKALNALDPAKYHLHIVGMGNWQSKLKWIKHGNYTFHGALKLHKLRKVYSLCHIVINPSYRGTLSTHDLFLINLGRLIPLLRGRANRILPTHERYIILDGFPTVMCQDAMSTGCCLISTNPRPDYLALKPGEDYLEIGEKSSEEIVNSVQYLYDNQDKMLLIAKNGHQKMLECFDTKKIVRFKYNIIKGKTNNLNL